MDSRIVCFVLAGRYVASAGGLAEVLGLFWLKRFNRYPTSEFRALGSSSRSLARGLEEPTE